jgi:hypothetical protein
MRAPHGRHQCAPRGPAALAVGGIGAGERPVIGGLVGPVSYGAGYVRAPVSSHTGWGVLAGAARGVVPEVSAPDSGRAGCPPVGRAVERVADEHGWQMVATEVMPDHRQLFVRVGPTDAPAQVVWVFKGRTARVLRGSFRTWVTRRRCGGRRPPSPPRSATSGSRRCAASSSTGGMR